MGVCVIVETRIENELEEKMFEQIFKNVDDVLWKDPGCGSELDYVEQTSWILFLKYIEELGQEKLPDLLKIKYYALNHKK